MKANELMVGDWFRFCYTIDGKEIVRTFRISQIENELGKYYVWGNGFGRMCYPDRLEPIPITPEILEKNRFKRAKYGYEWKEHIGGYMGQTTSSTTPIEIMYYDEGHCVVSNPHIGRMFQGSIDSVHELQHALRLCGIDKEIEL